MSTPNAPASNDFVLVPREAVTSVLARCETLEDEASNALENEQTEHAAGFWRGQKSTAKSVRAQLHDATRAALAAAPASPEPASNEAPGRGGVERPSDDDLDPHLPEHLKAERRLGIQTSDWLPGWYVPWSPRNDNQNAEGPWSHWVLLAEAILEADRSARAALAAQVSK